MNNLADYNSLFRVLAITSHQGAIAELRLLNPLRALHRMHLITGYEVVDTNLDILKNDNRLFHTILIQRAVPEYIYQALNSQEIPYALDIDDNILAIPAYRDDARYNGILTGLSGCTTLIASHTRLVELLQKYSGYSLMGKSAIAPNALPYQGISEKFISQPKQLLWIQSDIAALTDSLNTIVKAVGDFAQKYNLPVILIGKKVLQEMNLPNQVIMGEIDFTANLQLLEQYPTSIGIAPLETSTDKETCDFIAGKSDLKMLLFTGFGHPGVYSASPPYEDSPFRDCGMLVSNTYEDWFHALEYQYHTGWKNVFPYALNIQKERDIHQIARDNWMPAIERCRLDKPMSGREIYTTVMRTRRRYMPMLKGYQVLLKLGVQKNALLNLYYIMNTRLR